MSGHSKWHKIKHQKEVTDKKKGQMFGKFAREIASLARSEKDPAKNPALREAITRAKKANMPQENIDRLLSGSDKPMQPVTYEGFGPGGSALIVSAETDNTNRTVSELRQLFKENSGQLATPGSVMWKFTRTQTENGIGFVANQPAILSDSDKETFINLYTVIQNHPDVVTVTTDVSLHASPEDLQ